MTAASTRTSTGASSRNPTGEFGPGQGGGSRRLPPPCHSQHAWSLPHRCLRDVWCDPVEAFDRDHVDAPSSPLSSSRRRRNSTAREIQAVECASCPLSPQSVRAASHWALRPCRRPRRAGGSRGKPQDPPHRTRAARHQHPLLRLLSAARPAAHRCGAQGRRPRRADLRAAGGAHRPRRRRLGRPRRDLDDHLDGAVRLRAGGRAAGRRTPRDHRRPSPVLRA